jgi:hypothetical protein
VRVAVQSTRLLTFVSHPVSRLTFAAILVVGADPAAVVDVLRVAARKPCRAVGQRVVVHVVQLAVVVGAGRGAEVEVRAAEELGLDLARAAARLLTVGLENERETTLLQGDLKCVFQTPDLNS